MNCKTIKALFPFSFRSRCMNNIIIRLLVFHHLHEPRYSLGKWKETKLFPVDKNNFEYSEINFFACKLLLRIPHSPLTAVK
jgi:hypothetical protein